MLNNYDQISVGSIAVIDALAVLQASIQRKPYHPIAADVRALTGKARCRISGGVENDRAASARMTPDRQQYFYENVMFPLLVDSRQTTAAIN